MVGKHANIYSACRAGLRVLRYRARHAWQRLRHGKDENSPVSEDEFILRRIHKNNYDATLSDPVKRPAFEPNRNDEDGLSVHRELFVTARRLASTGRKPGEYYIARLSVRELMGSEYLLTVKASPDLEQPPGHAVIPELSASEVAKDRPKSKRLEKKLAVLASKNIVYKASEAYG